jgi:hypothetical protein
MLSITDRTPIGPITKRGNEETIIKVNTDVMICPLLDVALLIPYILMISEPMTEGRKFPTKTLTKFRTFVTLKGTNTLWIESNFCHI